MSFEPSEDPDALSAHVAGAARVLIYDSGCMHYQGLGDGREGEILSKDPILEVSGRTALTELTEHLRVSSVTDVFCMCTGNASMEFLGSSGERLAVASLHHGTGLRWSGWSGDAELANGPGLVAWLSKLGYDGPQSAVQRAEAERAGTLSTQEAWSAAAPECVRSLLPAVLSNGSLYDEGIVAEIDAILAAAFPDAVERCRLTLAWFAAGTGRCSGYPMHEEIPEKILAELPISVVLEALAGEPTTSAAWAGALRHIAGWKTRSKGELLQIPPTVWDALLDIAKQGSDADKLARIERKAAEHRAEW